MYFMRFLLKYIQQLMIFILKLYLYLIVLNIYLKCSGNEFVILTS